MDLTKGLRLAVMFAALTPPVFSPPVTVRALAEAVVNISCGARFWRARCCGDSFVGFDF